MSRYPRKQSETDFYHVYNRGSGRQLIYENQDDRIMFLNCLNAALANSETTLYAYAEMGNHYHLVLSASYERLSIFGHALNSAYARYFNDAHGRSGHLFQERFSSQPIEDDSHFLTAIRYVHRNPVEAGLAPTCAYPWSSYASYLGQRTWLTDPVSSEAVPTPHVKVDTAKALEMLGGVDAFQDFHSHPGSEAFIDDAPMPTAMAEPDMLAAASDLLGGSSPAAVKSLPKKDRDRSLRALKSAFSIRQVALMTGVSRSVVQRA